MPFHFEFDPVNEILRGRVEGPLTDESLKVFYRLAGEYVARVQPRGGIVDFSAVTSFEVSSETIHQLAHLEPPLPDPTLPRVVVAPSGISFGLSRMFQAIRGDTEPKLQVVRTLDEAYAFLGIHASRFEPLAEAASDGSAG